MSAPDKWTEMARANLHDNQLEISGFLQSVMLSGPESKKASLKKAKVKKEEIISWVQAESQTLR